MREGAANRLADIEDPTIKAAATIKDAMSEPWRTHLLYKISVPTLNCRKITHAASNLSRAARARLILSRITALSAFHL